MKLHTVIIYFFILLSGNIPMLYAESLTTHYRLPPLERAIIAQDKYGRAAQALLEKARVLKRAQEVSILFTQIEDPVKYSDQLRSDIQTHFPTMIDIQPSIFTGEKSSELNQFLGSLPPPRHVILQTATIQLDEILKIPSDTLLNGRNAMLTTETVLSPATVLVTGNNVVIRDLSIKTPGLGLRVTDAQNIILRNLSFANVERGISIGNNSHFIELDRIMITNSQAGMSIHNDVSHVWLHHSIIRNSLRADNGGAGLLVSDAKPRESFEESTHQGLEETIYPTVPAPHALLIEHNEFSHNVAQGVYFDGGYGSVIRANQITDNDKEGICLDFGSSNNILMENSFINNGRRARQSDDALAKDHVLGFGRLVDGSAVSKLPGVALDNAAQNMVLWNTIRDNSGDGIKIVRTGIRNLFLSNTIISNNQGNNSRFHFFGILLGGAKLEPGIDPNAHPLDFLPSLENIIAGNTIYGEHWSGVLLDTDAMFNDIYDNAVHHFLNRPFESASNYPNSTLGNNWEHVPRTWGQSLRTCLRGLVYWWECL